MGEQEFQGQEERSEESVIASAHVKALMSSPGWRLAMRFLNTALALMEREAMTPETDDGIALARLRQAQGAKYLAEKWMAALEITAHEADPNEIN